MRGGKHAPDESRVMNSFAGFVCERLSVFFWGVEISFLMAWLLYDTITAMLGIGLSRINSIV
jgi:hypothetical protein